MAEIQPPNWTDILQGIGAIAAVPGAIAAFIFLFLKDKNKQRQIDELKGVAEKIEAQNEIMAQSNKLAVEQIEVLQKVLVNPSSGGFNKLAEIEEKKLKLSMQPNLKGTIQYFTGKAFQIRVVNYGEPVEVESIEHLSKEYSPQGGIKPGFEIPKDGQIIVGGNSNGNSLASQLSFEIRLNVVDRIKNRYQLKIIRDPSTNQTISRQEEILN